ncbi:GNAT family N-acetyltransferase [Mixta intestinalis]|nr:GNAT family N-acetyltransferase [Mixta intestinalis]
MSKRMARLSGWEEASAADYQRAYLRYGGNFSTHPEVLAIQSQQLKVNQRYFVKTTRLGEIKGALCVWNNQFIANDYATANIVSTADLPIARDELILPLAADEKFFLPFNSKILSACHRQQIINTTYRVNAGRTLCLAKSVAQFSAKTRQTRKKELRKFLLQGGEVLPIQQFSADDVSMIYAELFFKRRNRKIEKSDEQRDFLRQIKPHIFGNILFFNGNPCAIQLIMKAESERHITYDYINIGLDPALSALSPGTIITWLNVQQADSECQHKGKAMRFSFGRPTVDYKNRWCYQEPVGRILTL